MRRRRHTPPFAKRDDFHRFGIESDDQPGREPQGPVLLAGSRRSGRGRGGPLEARRKPWAERTGDLSAGYFRQKAAKSGKGWQRAAKAANAGFAALVFGKTGCNCTCTCSCSCNCPCNCNCTCTCSCLSHRERQKTLCAGGTHRLLRRGRRLPPVWDRTR